MTAQPMDYSAYQTLNITRRGAGGAVLAPSARYPSSTSATKRSDASAAASPARSMTPALAISRIATSSAPP